MGDLVSMFVTFVVVVVVMCGGIYLWCEYGSFDWVNRLLGRPTYKQQYYIGRERQARQKVDQLFTEAETKMNRLVGQDDRFKFDDWGSL